MGFFQRIKRNSLERELSHRELEKRYEGRIVAKKEKSVRENLLKISLQNIEQMQLLGRRTSAMSYYDELVTTDARMKEVQNFKGKVIGTFCNFVPEELIYAAGAIPIRLCAGFYDTIHPAEEILPKDICPLIKSAFGFKLLGLPYFELCDVVIVPTTCDGKKKLGELLVPYLPVWMLEIPHSKDYLKGEVWLTEIKVLKRRIEEFTQTKITKEGLKDAILLLHKRQEVFRRLYRIRKYDPPVITGSDAMLVVQTSFYDDIRRWIKRTNELCKELEEQRSNNSHLPDVQVTNNRLLLTGAPIIWPNFKLIHIIEAAEATIVMDDMCSGTQHLYDPVVVDEWTLTGMLRAIAERYLLPSTCPCFTSSDDRIDRLLERIKGFAVDGVIYHNLRLCQLFDIEQQTIKQILKDKGIPMLSIHTDYSREDIEQIKTRVEAFLEMLKR
ncbi:MAG TPA: 2-hydroxyacyl-CoA dehydratase [bacterium (Candidatus Stahlbacteria)]|nr:2-hydroxyacyl-CoA dehydratase [Candidatus Stahlbacteria bacterium]